MSYFLRKSPAWAPGFTTEAHLVSKPLGFNLTGSFFCPTNCSEHHRALKKKITLLLCALKIWIWNGNKSRREVLLQFYWSSPRCLNPCLSYNSATAGKGYEPSRCTPCHNWLFNIPPLGHQIEPIHRGNYTRGRLPSLSPSRGRFFWARPRKSSS